METFGENTLLNAARGWVLAEAVSAAIAEDEWRRLIRIVTDDVTAADVLEYVSERMTTCEVDTGPLGSFTYAARLHTLAIMVGIATASLPRAGGAA